MGVPVPIVKTVLYEDYFKTVDTRLARRQGGLTGLAAGFMALVILLAAFVINNGRTQHVGEIVAVGLLSLIAMRGLSVARNTLTQMRATLGALREAAAFLDTGPSRKEYLEECSRKIDPNDHISVAEPMYALACVANPAEHVGSAASRVLAPAHSEMASLGVTRTTMVLGGLLGTVFFFSMEMRSDAFASGDLSALGAALLCTMTGVMGAIATGISVSGLDRELELLQSEVEAFFSAIVAPALTSDVEDQGLSGERALWESVRAAIQRLTKETVEQQARMVDQATEFASALRELELQLRKIPAVTVPPDLAKLSTSVDRFDSAARRLEAIVPPLIEAVSKMELVVPRHLMQRMDQVHAQTSQLKSQFDGVTDSLVRTGEDLRATVVQVREAAARIPDDLPRSLEEVARSSEEIRRNLDAAMGNIQSRSEATADEMRRVRQVIEPVPQQVHRIASLNEATAASMAGVLQQLGSAQLALTRVQGWIAAISRSPLMWLFTFPASRRYARKVDGETGA